MTRRHQPDRPSHADLVALADGSLPAARRADVERAVGESPELQAIVAAQRRSLDAIRDAAGPAPAALRGRIAAARVRPPLARARARTAAAALGVAAAAAVAVVLTVGGGPAPRRWPTPRCSRRGRRRHPLPRTTVTAPRWRSLAPPGCPIPTGRIASDGRPSAPVATVSAAARPPPCLPSRRQAHRLHDRLGSLTPGRCGHVHGRPGRDRPAQLRGARADRRHLVAPRSHLRALGDRRRASGPAPPRRLEGTRRAPVLTRSGSGTA